MNGFGWRKAPRHPHGNRRPVTRATHSAHLRARVFKVGSTWHMEVVNTHTGDVVARDNTGCWGVMFDLADVTVGAARRAHHQGFAKKSLR